MLQNRRQSIRLKGFDYAQAGGYFVTLVCSDRLCILGECGEDAVSLFEIGQMVEREWKKLPLRFKFIEPDNYVVMPNHLHGILFFQEGTGDAEKTERVEIKPRAPTKEAYQAPVVGSLPTVMRSFKAACTQRYHWMGGQGDLWQRNYFEHVIRNDADLDRIRKYIRDNPLQWKLDEENQDVS